MPPTEDEWERAHALWDASEAAERKRAEERAYQRDRALGKVLGQIACYLELLQEPPIPAQVLLQEMGDEERFNLCEHLFGRVKQALSQRR